MPEAPQRKRISRLLIVEDDDAQRSTLTGIMQDEGFEVEGCAKAAEALERMNRQAFGMVIVHQRLPDFSGTQLLEKIRAMDGRVPVIVYTGYGSFDSAKSAVNLGAFAYIEKLGDPSELVRQVHRAFREGLSSYAEDLEAEVARRTASLQESEERFDLAVKGSQDGLWDWDVSTDREWWSPRIYELLGYRDGEIKATRENFKELLHPDHRGTTLEAVRAHLEDRVLYDVEYLLQTKSGEYRWFRGRGQALWDKDGKPVRMSGSIRDVHDRKQSEEALREQARLQQIFLDNLPSVAMLLRPRTREIVACNKAGREVGAIPGKTCFKTWGRSDTPCPWCLAPKLWETGEAQHLQPEGVGRIWDAHWIPISDDLYLHYAYDITDRKRVEDESKLNEARLNTLHQLTRMEEEAETKVLAYVMEEAVRLTGSRIGFLGLMSDDEAILTVHSYSKAVMQECAIDDKPLIFPIARAGLWGKAVRQRKPVVVNDYDGLDVGKKGYPKGHMPVSRFLSIPVFDGGRIVAVAAVANKEKAYDDGDVRQLTLLMNGVWRFLQRKRTEQELARYSDHLEELVEERTRALEQSRAQLQASQRLASVGTLAAGIAHEINNPVGAILLAAENLLSVKGQPKAEQLMDSCLSSIVGNARRCRMITRSVLQFARQETTDKWPDHLHRIINRAVELAHPRAVDDGGIIELKFADALPEVVMNPIEIEQVLVNLIRNALESAPRGVHVRISTQAAPEAVRIVVEDNGRGIPPEHLARIYDPFFTTRREEGGSGLGLSIVHGIIADHGGSIDVESRVGRGTVFTMTLPLTPTQDREAVRGQTLDR